MLVHIKSLAGRANRLVENDAVTYELSFNEKGQPRAGNVAFVGDRARRSPAANTGASSLIAAAGFLGAIAILVLAGKLPALLFGSYLGLSLLTLIAYAVDQSAARNHRRRTRESTLHMLALAGGWPGALFAQQLYRHKSTKHDFRAAFWLTVAIKCGHQLRRSRLAAVVVGWGFLAELIWVVTIFPDYKKSGIQRAFHEATSRSTTTSRHYSKHGQFVK